MFEAAAEWKTWPLLTNTHISHISQNLVESSLTKPQKGLNSGPIEIQLFNLKFNLFYLDAIFHKYVQNILNFSSSLTLPKCLMHEASVFIGKATYTASGNLHRVRNP